MWKRPKDNMYHDKSERRKEKKNLHKCSKNLLTVIFQWFSMVWNMKISSIENCKKCGPHKIYKFEYIMSNWDECKYFIRCVLSIGTRHLNWEVTGNFRLYCRWTLCISQFNSYTQNTFYLLRNTAKAALLLSFTRSILKLFEFYTPNLSVSFEWIGDIFINDYFSSFFHTHFPSNI